MPLVVDCSNCGRRYALDERLAGKRVKCQQCGAVFFAAVGGPAAYRPIPAEPEDPFADLARLEPPGAAPPPPMPALVVPASGRRAGYAGVPSHAAGPAFDPPVVRVERPIRANDAVGLDPLTPVLILAFLVTVVALVVAMHRAIPDEATPAALSLGRGIAWTKGIALAAAMFAVIGPAVWLAVWVTSLILRFELPGGAYVRSVGVATMPFVGLLAIKHLVPEVLPLRLGLVVALLPLTFYALKFAHGLLLPEALLAFVLATVGYIGGSLVCTLAVAMVAAATVAGSPQAARELAQAVSRQQAGSGTDAPEVDGPDGWASGLVSPSPQTADRSRRPAPPGRPTPPSARPPPSPATPGSRAVNDARFDLGAADPIGAEAFGPADPLRKLAAAEAKIAAGQSAFPREAAWADLARSAAELRAKLEALPPAHPPADLFEAASTAGLARLDAAADVAAGLAAEVSFGPARFRPPADAKLDLSRAASPAEPLAYNRPDGGRLTLAVARRSNLTQRRPYVLTKRYQAGEARKQRLFVVEAVDGEPVTAGTLGGAPFVRVADAPGLGLRYAGLVGDAWVTVTIRGGAGRDASAEAAFDAAARTLRPARPGEPPADPFAPDRVAAQFADQPDEVGELFRRHPAEAEPHVIRFLASDNVWARRKAAELLPSVATIKSVPQLEQVARNRDRDVTAAVRAALRRLAPDRFDDVTDALVDLADTDIFRRRDALVALAKLRPPADPARRAAVAAALEPALLGEERFGTDPKLAGEALAVWATDKTAARLAPALNDPRLGGGRRTGLITALGGTKDRLAVNVVMKWLPKETALVTQTLIKMGPVAEEETIRVLNLYFANRTPEGTTVRSACVAILTEIGSRRSFEALGRASRDTRDAVAQESARLAIKEIEIRSAAANPASAPASRPATQPRVPARPAAAGPVPRT